MGTHPNLKALDEALAQSQAQNVREFLGYFRKLHPQDRLPGRDAFDPIELPRLLPDIVLAKVVPSDTPDMKYRFLVKVAGDTVLKSVDRPIIGRYLDEFVTAEDPSPRYPIADREQVVETGCLVFRRGKPRLKFRLDFSSIEVCHFPLASDGRTVDHVISIIVYEALDRDAFSGK
ncbi:hypothetical protein [Oceanibaculum sp.]|uniref:hypothetical protein n=1 Tax=Oceanibaculum sp. TaxID=1903597 RepID=UPI00258EF8A7|nr:hypothetical protein [Oceanibaculum sp.]MCH2393457.1 hypothetical protein [Oceanibaculum sp.]